MSTHYKDYYGTHMPFGQFPKFGVLSSVKVLMTGTNIAGPFAASIMAEMGAQVVQVESPNMPCQTRGNYGYSQDHRNTYSITLNTRTAKGKEVLEKLIAWADIWIESGRPGTYAKNGLSDEHMWKINRKLAIVHVSGYGQTGPDKNKAAYDVSGQAMGGYMYMNGTSPTSPPLKVNPYLSDYATAYNACICALSIMTNARITGEGDACDVSQYETMFRLLGSYPAELEEGSLVAELYGTTHVTERHRHRYEVNVAYKDQLREGGLRISGQSPDGELTEFVELPREVHPFYVATQAHPEFKSRPTKPHPLFAGLVKAALDHQQAR